MRLPLCFKTPYSTLIPDSYPVHLEARTQVTTERGGMDMLTRESTSDFWCADYVVS